MSKLDAKKIGLTLGLLFAFYYLIWTIALVFGGQSLLNWILSIHLMSMPITIQFSITTAIIGLIYHFIIGLVVGYVFVWFYNNYF